LISFRRISAPAAGLALLAGAEMRRNEIKELETLKTIGGTHGKTPAQKPRPILFDSSTAYS